MKQILQNIRNGVTEVADVPAPRAGAGQLLVHTSRSLVSAGTERMLVEFGKANWIQKARQQPDKVRMVLDKVRTDGIVATLDAVHSKLDQPLALGYCNVGRVAEVGPGVESFAVGDRVISNGKHAEVIAVPKNLCARIPVGVSDDEASFTVLAAIGLQGIRLANPTLGEHVVVTGLGLIGLLTVQMLVAQGCQVLGIDFDPERLALARRFGARVVNPGSGEDVLAATTTFTKGRGVDAVLITASTSSNEPVSQAAKMCRQRGRIVLVGVSGLALSRADFYEKELTFQVSCSYGPGRYDPQYEDAGNDYPIGFVRWTEQRNFEAVLNLMADSRLDLNPLISHRFDISKAEEAYRLLSSQERSLGIILEYQHGLSAFGERDLARPSVFLSPRSTRKGAGTVAFLGAGNYAGRVLIPAFKAAGATLDTIVSSGGVSAVHFGSKFGFAQASTDGSAVLVEEAIDAVVIATRHDSHARQVIDALNAGKHVFCEKPLCLTVAELADIEKAALASERLLLVGFNRRFSPHVVRAKALLDSLAEPKSFVMTVNAGTIPADHWTQDRKAGGGRIVGEACHFVDLLRHLAGSAITGYTATSMGRHPAVAITDDKAMITLQFADGSVGTVHYLANGHKAFPKERLEIFCAGRVLQLDNFRKMRGWGWRNFSKMNLWRQDKGQSECARAFMNAVREGNASPIPLPEILEVSRVSIELAEALAT